MSSTDTSVSDLHVIYARDVPDSAALRAASRAEHLALIGAHADRIVFAGPLLDGDRPCGAVIVMRGSREEAEVLMAKDPFTTAGVYKTVEITRFRLVDLKALQA